MVGFFTKKSFFDGWDNFLSLVLQNLVYIALFALALTLIYFWGSSALVFYSILVVFLLISSISMGGTAEVCKNYSNYKSDTWSVYVKGIKRNISHSLVFFLFLIFIVIMVTLTIPFYSALSGVMGLILTLIMFWVLLFFLLAIPYYFPLMTLLPGDGPFKTFRKAFLIVFDNPGPTLYLFLHIIIDTVLSVLTMGLVPGICGIMLSGQDMMKLLMKKYDWLEENPNKTKKDLNWDELLQEEKDTIGPRSLKRMIFPWK